MQDIVVFLVAGGWSSLCCCVSPDAQREGEKKREREDVLGQTDQQWPSFPPARDSTKLFCLAACGFGHHGRDMWLEPEYTQLQLFFIFFSKMDELQSH